MPIEVLVDERVGILTKSYELCHVVSRSLPRGLIVRTYVEINNISPMMQ